MTPNYASLRRKLNILSGLTPMPANSTAPQSNAAVTVFVEPFVLILSRAFANRCALAMYSSSTRNRCVVFKILHESCQSAVALARLR
jgi:hypothetical protein